VLTVSVALDVYGHIASGPQVRGLGMPSDADNPLEDILDDLAGVAEQAVMGMDSDSREDDRMVEQTINRALKRASYHVWSRRPIVESTVLRV
jgi:ribonuclease J